MSNDRIGVVCEEHVIPSDATDIQLRVHHKHSSRFGDDVKATPLVLIHGATYSSGSLFDVELGGTSMLDALARRGIDTFAMDVRGYGHSDRPAEFKTPADSAQPSVGTAIGLRDLASVVEWVRTAYDTDQVDVLGMSWGGSVAAAYAAANPDVVRRLVLVAPLWLNDGDVPIDTGGALGAHRDVDVAGYRDHWLGAVPESARDRHLPEGWFEAWARATVAEEPDGARRQAGLIRAANGPIQDIRDYWTAGRPFYDPANITATVLLLHGEWDVDVPLDVVRALFSRLDSPKRWVEYGRSTHMLLLERQRLEAFGAIGDFLQTTSEGDR